MPLYAEFAISYENLMSTKSTSEIHVNTYNIFWIFSDLCKMSTEIYVKLLSNTKSLWHSVKTCKLPMKVETV